MASINETTSRRRRLKPIDEAIIFIKEGRDKATFEDQFVDDYTGKGVIATDYYRGGDFLLEYSGELIEEKKAVKSETLYKKKKAGNFLFFFDHGGQTLCLDATYDTRLGRLVNDEQKTPNCVMKKVEVDGHPHLCLFAVNDIKPNEELRYNYGPDKEKKMWWRYRKQINSQDDELGQEETSCSYCSKQINSQDDEPGQEETSCSYCSKQINSQDEEPGQEQAIKQGQKTKTDNSLEETEKERKMRCKKNTLEKAEERKKKAKCEQKKKETINFRQTEDKLNQMDREIKKALSLENPDISKCMVIMNKLEHLSVNTILLQKNPDILNTIKKCRKYKGSNKIQWKAEFIYNKFKAVFTTENVKIAPPQSEIAEPVGFNRQKSAFPSEGSAFTPESPAPSLEEDTPKVVPASPEEPPKPEEKEKEEVTGGKVETKDGRKAIETEEKDEEKAVETEESVEKKAMETEENVEKMAIETEEKDEEKAVENEESVEKKAMETEENVEKMAIEIEEKDEKQAIETEEKEETKTFEVSDTQPTEPQETKESSEALEEKKDGLTKEEELVDDFNKLAVDLERMVDEDEKSSKDGEKEEIVSVVVSGDETKPKEEAEEKEAGETNVQDSKKQEEKSVDESGAYIPDTEVEGKTVGEHATIVTIGDGDLNDKLQENPPTVSNHANDATEPSQIIMILDEQSGHFVEVIDESVSVDASDEDIHDNLPARRNSTP